MHAFKFELGQVVRIAVSGERGTVIGCAKYDGSEDHYQLRYMAADGKATEAWWAGSALEVA